MSFETATSGAGPSNRVVKASALPAVGELMRRPARGSRHCVPWRPGARPRVRPCDRRSGTSAWRTARSRRRTVMTIMNTRRRAEDPVEDVAEPEEQRDDHGGFDAEADGILGVGDAGAASGGASLIQSGSLQPFRGVRDRRACERDAQPSRPDHPSATRTAGLCARSSSDPVSDRPTPPPPLTRRAHPRRCSRGGAPGRSGAAPCTARCRAAMIPNGRYVGFAPGERRVQHERRQQRGPAPTGSRTLRRWP